MTYEAKDTDLRDRDSNKTAEDDGFNVPTAEKLLEGLPGYKVMKPMVFCGLYPIDNSKYNDLREALEKLQLNDAA